MILFLFVYQCFESKSVGVQSKTAEYSLTNTSNHRYMAKGFATMHVRNVHFDHWSGDRTNGILQSNGCMGISSSIENNPVYFKPRLLDTVNHFSFYVRLKIIYFYINIRLTEVQEIVLESNTPIDGRFALAQQIYIGAINNLYPHHSNPTIFKYLCPKEHYFKVQR